ncbi:MAG: hypothetical protein RML94_09580 [Bacteroidia bacterium]|nr:hypothetical protein [Bacteroidia bacterium]
MKPRICFFVTDTYIPYSPTILGLYRLLSPLFHIDIIMYYPNIKKFHEINIDIQFLSLKPKKFDLSFQIYKRLLRKNSKEKLSYNDYILVRELRESIKKKKYVFIIAVDIYALYIVQKSYDGPIHFISLELHYHTHMINKIDPTKISSILIQRRDRYEYLFPNYEIKNIFYVQNTTFYKDIQIDITKRDPYLLLHAGTGQDIFGIYAILNFIGKYENYKIYLKGSCFPCVKSDIVKLYTDALQTNRIVIDEKYESEEKVVDFISNYYIGLCFYDLSIEKANNFNYLTAPSGKLFKYIAAGVPVIGNNIPGLSIVEEFRLGVLIPNLSSSSIMSAVEKIKSNYEEYVSNCLSTAKKLSFDKLASNYIHFLQSNGMES